MSMYSQFATDQGLEKNGVILDYGHFRVTVARAGGSNKKFSRLLEKKTKPYRRQIQNESMDDIVAERIIREVYAECIIQNWETKEGDKWKKGIEGKDGKILPFCNQNIYDTLTNLPELFIDIQQQAGKAAIFKQEIQEDDAKN
jgi:hypothetical protein